MTNPQPAPREPEPVRAERVSKLEQLLAAARLEGVRLGLEAAAVMFDEMAREAERCVTTFVTDDGKEAAIAEAEMNHADAVRIRSLNAEAIAVKEEK